MGRVRNFAAVLGCFALALCLTGVLQSRSAAAGPLAAGEELVFVKLSSAPADLDPKLRLRLAAGAKAASISQISGVAPHFDLFEFSLGGVVIAAVDFAPVDPMCFDCLLTWDIAYDGADRLDVRWNNQQYDLHLAIADGLMFGSFNTDFPGPEACRTTGVCAFRGVMTPVPAPTGFALLALGLGVLLSRRPNG